VLKEVSEKEEEERRKRKVGGGKEKVRKRDCEGNEKGEIRWRK
jgi:hypothetical protein